VVASSSRSRVITRHGTEPGCCNVLGVTDPHTAPLPPPSDPWAGRASVPSVPSAPPTGIMPHVVFVQRPRRKRWPWVLGVFGIIAMLCCGSCFALNAFTAPIRAQYPARVAALPQELPGLRRSDDPIVRTIAAAAVERFRWEPYVDDAFAAMYVDPKSRDRQVIVFGATALLLDPGGELDKQVKSAGDTISGVTTYPPGLMGGQLRCANGKDDKNKPVVLCAWADHGSLGVAMCHGRRPMDECAALLGTLREKIIIRP